MATTSIMLVKLTVRILLTESEERASMVTESLKDKS